jgi:putative hydrolase of the HAD superfamily
MAKPLVVFDLDDTLYAEADYVRSGFAAVERALSLSGFAEEAWKLYCGGTRGNVFDRTLETLDRAVDKDTIARLVRVYREHTPCISLAVDAVPVLEELVRAADLALITDGFAIAQRRKVERLGLDRWFSRIVITDELGADFWKPHVAAFQLVQNGREGSRCAYVADNPRKDFHAPQALGWHCIRVRRPEGLWASEPCGDVAAHAEMPSLTTLLERLQGLGLL